MGASVKRAEPFPVRSRRSIARCTDRLIGSVQPTMASCRRQRVFFQALPLRRRASARFRNRRCAQARTSHV